MMAAELFVPADSPEPDVKPMSTEAESEDKKKYIGCIITEEWLGIACFRRH